MKQAVVVSDTSPIHYLVLIEAEQLLGRLFLEVLVPSAVAKELSHPKTPLLVREWIHVPPPWLKISALRSLARPLGLDAGETEAILLAQELGIPSLLIDERKGFRVAENFGLKPIGLLGILEFSASQGWIDFPEYIARLRTTNFRFQERLIIEIARRLSDERA